MKVYVLTQEYNMYDQFGEYFIEVFKELPTEEQLTAKGVRKDRIKHVQQGGGRVDYEDDWFNLNQQEAL